MIALGCRFPDVSGLAEPDACATSTNGLAVRAVSRGGELLTGAARRFAKAMPAGRSTVSVRSVAGILFKICLACVLSQATVSDAVAWQSPPDPIPWMLGQSAARINQAYGVRVHYLFERESFFPKEWREAPFSAQGWQIRGDDALQMMPLIEEFLSRYPAQLITRNFARHLFAAKIVVLRARLRWHQQPRRHLRRK